MSSSSMILTITPALECAPISHASKTENSNDVATPPSSRPIIRIEKFLKSSSPIDMVGSTMIYDDERKSKAQSNVFIGQY